jgi:hypothetical protein
MVDKRQSCHHLKHNALLRLNINQLNTQISYSLHKFELKL